MFRSKKHSSLIRRLAQQNQELLPETHNLTNAAETMHTILLFAIHHDEQFLEWVNSRNEPGTAPIERLEMVIGLNRLHKLVDQAVAINAMSSRVVENLPEYAEGSKDLNTGLYL